MPALRTAPAFDTVIWDADGVLFNTFDERGKFRWSKTIAEDLKVDTGVFAHIFSSAWEDVLRGALDTRTHIAAALREVGSAVSADDYIAYWLEKDSSVNWEIAGLLHPARACIGTNQDPLRAAQVARLFAGQVRNVYSSSQIVCLVRRTGFESCAMAALPDRRHGSKCGGRSRVWLGSSSLYGRSGA
jgi:hypothetical protein